MTRPAFVTTTPATAVMTGLLALSGSITDSIPVFSFTERGDASLTIQVVSSDPAILRPEFPQVVIPAGGRTYTIPLLFSSNGSAFLTLSDSTGVYRTERTAPIEVRRAPLKLTPHAGIGGPDLVLGVRQRMLVALESPGAARSGFVVRIRSTNPSVAHPVQDSLPALGTGIDLIAGPQPGSAWLVAEGRGFSADSIRVTVTRSRIVAGNPGGLAAGRVNEGMTVRSVDENGNERVTLDSLFFRVRSTNGSRLFFVNSTGVIPAGASRSTSIIYNTVACGPVVAEVIATRPLAPFVETSTTSFVIVGPLAPLRAAPDSGTAARTQPPPRNP